MLAHESILTVGQSTSGLHRRQLFPCFFREVSGISQIGESVRGLFPEVDANNGGVSLSFRLRAMPTTLTETNRGDIHCMSILAGALSGPANVISNFQLAPALQWR